MPEETTSISLVGQSIQLHGALVISNVSRLLQEIEAILEQKRERFFIIDLSEVEKIDSAGVALLDELEGLAKKRGIELQLKNGRPVIKQTISTFSSKRFAEPPKKQKLKPSFFEAIGNQLVLTGQSLTYFFYLLADTVTYAIVGLYNKHGLRKGEFVNQGILIGVNALPIIGLISFLIGFILALQSAAQMRQFGAAIFVADLIAIAMTREMGPLITAIVIAGRSGSAITSEIATMVVTEENDALKSMALNPVRYVLVPKVYAITTTMPMLTILSMIIGILGAFVIGITYLDIGIEPFYNEIVGALVIKDIITGLVKSWVFAWIVVMIGAYYGFRVKGGSEEVGRATTASVVASIFYVILADCILGMIFYFGEPIIK